MSEAGRDAALAALVSQIEDLQSRLLFQDDALSQLDEVVIAQAGQLARLQHQVAELAEKLQQLRDERGASSPPVDEKPPHY